MRAFISHRSDRRFFEQTQHYGPRNIISSRHWINSIKHASSRFYTPTINVSMTDHWFPRSLVFFRHLLKQRACPVHISNSRIPQNHWIPRHSNIFPCNLIKHPLSLRQIRRFQIQRQDGIRRLFNKFVSFISYDQHSELQITRYFDPVRLNASVCRSGLF